MLYRQSLQPMALVLAQEAALESRWYKWVQAQVP
jgi:hypothetical protein